MPFVGDTKNQNLWYLISMTKITILSDHPKPCLTVWPKSSFFFDGQFLLASTVNVIERKTNLELVLDKKHTRILHLITSCLTPHIHVSLLLPS